MVDSKMDTREWTVPEFLDETFRELVDLVNIGLNSGKISEPEISALLIRYTTHLQKILQDLGKDPRNRNAIVDAQLKAIQEVSNYEWRVESKEPH